MARIMTQPGFFPAFAGPPLSLPGITAADHLLFPALTYNETFASLMPFLSDRKTIRLKNEERRI